jgi:hypothetical protein
VEALGPVDLPITRRGKHLNYHAGKSNYMIWMCNTVEPPITDTLINGHLQ